MIILKYFGVKETFEIAKSLKMEHLLRTFPVLANCTSFSLERDDIINFYSPHHHEYFALDLNNESLVRHATMYKLK